MAGNCWSPRVELCCTEPVGLCWCAHTRARARACVSTVGCAALQLWAWPEPECGGKGCVLPCCGVCTRGDPDVWVDLGVEVCGADSLGGPHTWLTGLCCESCGLRGDGWWVVVVCEHMHTGRCGELGEVFLRYVLCQCVLGCVPCCVCGKYGL